MNKLIKYNKNIKNRKIINHSNKKKIQLFKDKKQKSLIIFNGINYTFN